MSNISIFYIVIAVVVTIVAIYVQTKLVYRAKVNKIWKGILGLLMILFAITTATLSHSLDDYVSGGLVVYFFLIFLIWRQGLTNKFTVSGSNKSRPYTGFNKIIVGPTESGQGSEVGFVIIGLRDSFMQFNAEPKEIASFLKQHTNPKNIELRERPIKQKKPSK